MGYEVRYRFAEISIAVITISLAIPFNLGNRKLVQTQLPGIIHTAWSKNRVALIITFWSCCDIYTFDYWNEWSECSVRNGWSGDGDWS